VVAFSKLGIKIDWETECSSQGFEIFVKSEKSFCGHA
jgi:hypothetical protein